MSDYIGETHPKARKAHRCGLCYYTIPKGMAHTARQCKEDGRVYTFRMHDACESLTRDWDEEEWEYSEPWTFRAHPTFVTHPDHDAIVALDPPAPAPSAPAMLRVPQGCRPMTKDESEAYGEVLDVLFDETKKGTKP